MPIREQWARCYLKNYRNFRARVTSPTEFSNIAIKSYLLNGRSNVFILIQTILIILREQVKVLEQKRAT